MQQPINPCANIYTILYTNKQTYTHMYRQTHPQQCSIWWSFTDVLVGESEILCPVQNDGWTDANRNKPFFFSQSLISCIIFFLLFLPTSISYLNFLPLSSFFPALYLFFIHFFSRVSPIFLPDSILLIFCPPYLPSFLSSGPWRGTKSCWISGESVYTYIFTYVQGPSVTTLSSISLFCKKC